MLGKELGKLDKTASGTSAGSRIVVYGLSGSAEIYSGKPIVTAVSYKVVGDKLSGSEVSLFLSINIFVVDIAKVAVLC